MGTLWAVRGCERGTCGGCDGALVVSSVQGSKMALNGRTISYPLVHPSQRHDRIVLVCVRLETSEVDQRSQVMGLH